MDRLHIPLFHPGDELVHEVVLKVADIKSFKELHRKLDGQLVQLYIVELPLPWFELEHHHHDDWADHDDI